VRAQNPDMLECPTADCDYLFFKDENQTYWLCLKCETAYCLKCEMLYHVEQTCEEVQQAKTEADLQAKIDHINNNELPEDVLFQ